MPTYEYRCPDGHEFERFYRKISDAAPELACPECGKTAARRLSGGAGLVFKGSGFYLTDYGKNAHRKGAPPSSGGDGAKSEAGGDAKPAESSSGEKAGSTPTQSNSAESKNTDTGSSDKKAGSGGSKPSSKSDT